MRVSPLRCGRSSSFCWRCVVVGGVVQGLAWLTRGTLKILEVDTVMVVNFKAGVDLAAAICSIQELAEIAIQMSHECRSMRLQFVCAFKFQISSMA